MNHMKSLLIKFVSSLALLYIILGVIYEMDFGNVFLITLVLGVLSYIIGDLFILPRTNNTIATLADFGLALMVIWLLSENLAYGENIFRMSLIAAIGIALFESFFHRYLSSNMIDNQQKTSSKGNLQYQAEVSEELTPSKSYVRAPEHDEK